MVDIKYENISIAYGNFVVVKNLNLEIQHGEITTLLGPSGCGKTTLLRALAGFVEPFEGSIYLGGKDVTMLPPQKRNTAMIFQNYALWPHMSIFQNVEYGLKLRKYPELEAQRKWYCRFLWITRPLFFFVGSTYTRAFKELQKEKEEYFSESKGIIRQINWYLFSWWRYLKHVRSASFKNYLDFKAKKDPVFAYRRKKVHEVLKLVHLEDQVDKYPTQLSGGQQQRIALCRAIAVEPDVLLCDEPLSNLDAKLRKELRTEIRAIIKKIGMTTVYVTHDQTEALAISDRIAVLNAGKIEQYGTPTEVFTDPKTLFVAQFIGASSTMYGTVTGNNEVTLRGGEKVKIASKNPIKKGTEVALVVRPENISLTKKTDNPIEVTINTIEYLGTEVNMTGKLKDETIILIDVAEQTEEYAKYKVGDKITVYINTEDIFIFVDEKRVY